MASHPGYDGNYVNQASKSSSRTVSGVPQGSADPTNEPGQYPPGGWAQSIFGVAIPDNSGAPGSAGAMGTSTDPTNQPGQISDGLTGLSDAEIDMSGAPGSGGAKPDLGNNGGDAITFTNTGSYLDGSYTLDSVTDQTSGPADWTQANDSGYGTGGPQLPGLKGNEPTPGSGKWQTGRGNVLRGGRDVKP
jgi:hypothetical protein